MKNLRKITLITLLALGLGTLNACKPWMKSVLGIPEVSPIRLEPYARAGKMEASGKGVFLGIQVSKAEVGSVGGERTDTKLFIKTAPQILQAPARSVFDPALSQKLASGSLDAAIAKRFVDLDCLEAKAIPEYLTIGSMIGIADSPYDESKTTIFPPALKVLNENIGADIYVVFTARYDRKDTSIINALIYQKAKITPRIIVTVFDKTGAKILSKEYSKPYSLENYDLDNFEEACFNQIIALLKDEKDSINADLAFLKDLEDAQKSTNNSQGSSNQPNTNDYSSQK